MTAPAVFTGTSRRCLDKAGENNEINKASEQRGLIKRTGGGAGWGGDGVCVQERERIDGGESRREAYRSTRERKQSQRKGEEGNGRRNEIKKKR